jgi:hypothetical protein
MVRVRSRLRAKGPIGRPRCYGKGGRMSAPTNAAELFAACKLALAALQSESKLERANAIKALRDAIAKAEA